MTSIKDVPLNKRKYKPLQISYTALGFKNDNPRLWLEGLRLEKAGFKPGGNIKLLPVNELEALVIEASDKITNNTISKRTIRDVTRPIIDINRRELKELFGSYELVRVLYYKDKLIVQPHTRELSKKNALEDFEINRQSKMLTLGSVCVGGGVCTAAIKEGLALSGFDSESGWVIDIDNTYLQNTIDNTNIVGDSTTVVEGNLNHVETKYLTPVNVMLVSMPCTGFSASGRAKNQLANPESHDTAGLAILKTLELIEEQMPPVVINENVIPFESSASAALFAGKLKDLGYHFKAIRAGGEYGTLEDRQRSILIAYHPSLNLDVDMIMPIFYKPNQIKDILEDIPLDDPRWKHYEYLKAKAIRDKESGKGFELQELTGEETKCGVLGRSYFKVRSTEPRILHPENSELSRLLTPSEHAKVMGIPEAIIKNQSATTAHEILGQSGSYPLFKTLGKWLADELNKPEETVELQEQFESGERIEKQNNLTLDFS